MSPFPSTWIYRHPAMKKNSINFALVLLIVHTVFDLSSVAAVPSDEETSSASIDSTDYKSVCGKRLWKEPEARIVGGTNSKFADWPWAASIRHNRWKSGKFAHWCGASLITQHWVVTAAHCLEGLKPIDLRVRFGELDISREDEPLKHLDVEVEKIYLHPNYSDFIIDNDIALMQLKEPLTFQQHITPICLPEQYTNYTGKTAYVIGWGSTYETGPTQDALQEIQVPIISNYICQKRYMKTGYYRSDFDTFVCAGNEEGVFDACKGDSGGPLMVPREDGRIELVGISSWGYGCGEYNRPGVYTLVSDYLDWMEEIMKTK